MIIVFKCRADEKSDPKFKERGTLRSEGSDSQAVSTLATVVQFCLIRSCLTQESSFLSCSFNKDPD